MWAFSRIGITGGESFVAGPITTTILLPFTANACSAAGSASAGSPFVSTGKHLSWCPSTPPAPLTARTAALQIVALDCPFTEELPVNGSMMATSSVPFGWLAALLLPDELHAATTTRQLTLAARVTLLLNFFTLSPSLDEHAQLLVVSDALFDCDVVEGHLMPRLRSSYQHSNQSVVFEQVRRRPSFLHCAVGEDVGPVGYL